VRVFLAIAKARSYSNGYSLFKLGDNLSPVAVFGDSRGQGLRQVLTDRTDWHDSVVCLAVDIRLSISMTMYCGVQDRCRG